MDCLYIKKGVYAYFRVFISFYRLFSDFQSKLWIYSSKMEED